MSFSAQVRLPDPQSIPYRTARPFPSTKLDGLWCEDFLARVADEVEAFKNWDGEKQFYGSQAKRWCSTWERLPPTVSTMIHLSGRPEFLHWLEELTGEKHLLPDPYLNGAGIHSTDTGGFLKMHADFNWHENLGLYRRLNLLVYLNRDWDEAWGGDLRLATSEAEGLTVEQTIFPHFNTSVLFTTDDKSFHGQPDPISSPQGRARNSIALYYYSPVVPGGSAANKRVGTDYRKTDGSTFSPNSFSNKVRRRVGRFFGR